jgi:hypothetical protein
VLGESVDAFGPVILQGEQQSRGNLFGDHGRVEELRRWRGLPGLPGEHRGGSPRRASVARPGVTGGAGCGSPRRGRGGVGGLESFVGQQLHQVAGTASLGNLDRFRECLRLALEPREVGVGFDQGFVDVEGLALDAPSLLRVSEAKTEVLGAGTCLAEGVAGLVSVGPPELGRLMEV